MNDAGSTSGAQQPGAWRKYVRSTARGCSATADYLSSIGQCNGLPGGALAFSWWMRFAGISRWSWCRNASGCSGSITVAAAAAAVSGRHFRAEEATRPFITLSSPGGPALPPDTAQVAPCILADARASRGDGQASGLVDCDALSEQRPSTPTNYIAGTREAVWYNSLPCVMF